MVAVAAAAVGSLAILHLTDGATHSPATAAVRAGSFAASHDGLLDGRRPDGPNPRTTQLPVFLLVAAGVIAGLTAGRRSSPLADASPRRALPAVRGSRAPPVLSH